MNVREREHGDTRTHVTVLTDSSSSKSPIPIKQVLL